MVSTWIFVSIFFNLQSAKATLLPDNALNFADSYSLVGGVSESEFTEIIEKVIAIWRPYATLHGGKLLSQGDWASPTVNATANQDGPNWSVIVYGGLARRPELSVSSFALAICHELGHHFSGYPFFEEVEWPAGSEGQSDYFATQFCLRKVWADQADLNSKFRDLLKSDLAKNQCDLVWKETTHRDICYRTAVASQELSLLFHLLSLDADSNATPDFATPDRSEVTITNQYRSAAQCRLDTFFQGSLCTVHFDASKIPGKYPVPTNSRAAEDEAAKFSCMEKAGFSVGFRPRCWFKALI